MMLEVKRSVGLSLASPFICLLEQLPRVLPKGLRVRLAAEEGRGVKPRRVTA